MSSLGSKECSELLRAVVLEYITPDSVRKVVRRPRTEVVAQQESIPFKDGTLAISSWGQGKTVLLVHGWAANRTDMFAFVPALLERGFKVVAMDLPAHGQSSGQTAGLNQLGEGVLAVGAHLGRLQGVVAHSIGCAATQMAVAQGLSVEKAVMLASPNDYEKGFRAFAQRKGLDSAQTEELIQLLQDMGVRIKIKSVDFVPAFDIPALIVHSSDDPVIPMEVAEELSALWQGSQLLKVDGLSHRGVLKDQSVIEGVVQYLGN